MTKDMHKVNLMAAKTEHDLLMQTKQGVSAEAREDE